MDIAKEVGQRVRHYRVLTDLSQEGLARATGLSRETIRQIEAGKSYPRPETLEKIAGALSVTAAALLNVQEAV